MPKFIVAERQRTADLPQSSARDPIALGRHQTFHLRDGWLVKGLQALDRDGFAFARQGAHHQLGVGKNMLQSIRFWLLATGLAESDLEHRRGRNTPLRATPAAQLLLKWDPYLEDLGTQWIIHILLASRNGAAAAWYWLFNEFDGGDVTENELVVQLGEWLRDLAPEREFSEHALRREVSCVLRTYRVPSRDAPNPAEDELLSPLADLGLLSAIAGNLRVEVGPKPQLPLGPFLYALARFCRARDRDLLSIEELRWAPMSPGRLLCLDMNSLSRLLAQAEGEGAVRVSRTAGLQNVSVSRREPLRELERYYALAAA